MAAAHTGIGRPFPREGGAVPMRLLSEARRKRASAVRPLQKRKGRSGDEEPVQEPVFIVEPAPEPEPSVVSEKPEPTPFEKLKNWITGLIQVSDDE